MGIMFACLGILFRGLRVQVQNDILFRQARQEQEEEKAVSFQKVGGDFSDGEGETLLVEEHVGAHTKVEGGKSSADHLKKGTIKALIREVILNTIVD
jgi:hypothetical protein